MTKILFKRWLEKDLPKENLEVWEVYFTVSEEQLNNS